MDMSRNLRSLKSAQNASVASPGALDAADLENLCCRGGKRKYGMPRALVCLNGRKG
jgi:hypothetical protein